MANSTPELWVVEGGTSNRLCHPIPEEGEVKEMRLPPQERVVELAARGQGSAPGDFYDWTKETFGIRPDPQQSSALTSSCHLQCS